MDVRCIRRNKVDIAVQSVRSHMQETIQMNIWACMFASIDAVCSVRSSAVLLHKALCAALLLSCLPHLLHPGSRQEQLINMLGRSSSIVRQFPLALTYNAKQSQNHFLQMIKATM